MTPISSAATLQACLRLRALLASVRVLRRLHEPMPRPFPLLAAAAFTLVVAACEDDYYIVQAAPDSSANASDTAPTSGPDTDTMDGPGDIADEDVVVPSDTAWEATPEQWAGRACENDADCGGSPRQCLDRTVLDSFGVDGGIDVPGGLCSRLFCTDDSDCGPNGACVDAAFLGAPVQICLASCDLGAHCRADEGWLCTDGAVFDRRGLDVCVTDSIRQAAEADSGADR